MAKIKFYKAFIVLVTAGAFLMFCAGTAFSQQHSNSQGKGKRKGPSGQRGGPVKGEVVSIDSGTIIIASQNGQEETFQITGNTIVVQDMVVDLGYLTMSDTVFVQGERSEDESISARMIKILDKNDPGAGRRPSPQGKQAGQGRGGMKSGQGQQGQQGQQGRQGQQGKQGQQGRPGPQGPIFGRIVELDPLQIEETSGTTGQVQITAETTILKEVAVDISAIAPNVRVMVVGPMRPGMEQREAAKIILFTERGFEKKN